MWPHFTNLLARSWANLIHALSTSTLSVVVLSIVVPSLVWAVQWVGHGLDLKRRQVVSPFKTAFRDSGKSALVTGSVTVIVWLVLISVFTVRTIYEDHQSLVSRIWELLKDRKGDAETIKQLRNVPKTECPPPQKCGQRPAANDAARQASNEEERDKKLEIRTKLGEFLNKNNAIKVSCLTELPTGTPKYPCTQATNNWLQDCYVYIQNNMEASYAPRFAASTGLGLSYNAAHGNEEINNAVNTLTFKAAALNEFIRETH